MPFNSLDQIGVAPGRVITSETVGLTGLGAASTVSVSGCQVSTKGEAVACGSRLIAGSPGGRLFCHGAGCRVHQSGGTLRQRRRKSAW